jgi:hypothetical protein
MSLLQMAKGSEKWREKEAIVCQKCVSRFDGVSVARRNGYPGVWGDSPKKERYNARPLVAAFGTCFTIRVRRGNRHEHLT